MNSFTIVFFYFLLVNVTGFVMTAYDKRKAVKGEWRVPQKRFFLLAFIGGAFGIYVGMQQFRHKTKHAEFVYGIPLLILVNIVFYYIMGLRMKNILHMLIK